MANFQNALIAGVERYLDGNPALKRQEASPPGLAEEGAVYIGPAPAIEIVNHAGDNAALERLVRKFDPAARDARNRALGRRGEERALRSEHARLRAVGRDDLARRVRWVAEEEGDGAGYDILSFAENGEERFLEVKTTAGAGRTPFFVSSNERRFSNERPTEFRIFRLYDFAREPKAFLITPPLGEHFVLETASYRASFG
jgi:hypothetical protein